jgi:O-antigen ligase
MPISLPSLALWIRYCTYGLVLSLPISTAGVNLFSSLILVLALLSKEWWQAWHQLWRNPLVLCALMLFFSMLLGIFWTEGSSYEAWSVLGRYKKLLLIPLLLPFFSQRPHQRFALHLLLFSLSLTVLFSWTDFIGLTHISDPIYYPAPPGDAVFRMHITQGLLFLLNIVVAMGLALSSSNRLQKIIYIALAGLSAGDIIFVMVGRTGKALLPLLMLWIIGETIRIKMSGKWQIKQFPIWSVFAIAITLAGTAYFASKPDTMLGSIHQEVHESHQTGAVTSQGERVAFWTKGIKLFKQEPWLGHGTGSVISLTTQMARRSSRAVDQVPTFNLHNEYLMWAVQLGLLGLILIMMFFGLYLRAGLIASDLNGLVLRGSWLVFAAGCLFNSFLVDFTEGYSLVILLGLLSRL